MNRCLLLSSTILLLASGTSASAATRAGHHRPHTMPMRSGAEAIAVTGNRHRPGGGLIRAETAARSISTVSRDYISKQSPASNTLALLTLVPGANIAMGDPFGVTDQASITVRGLNQQEIGYTFEGIPMNDPDNYTPNSSEWVDSDNIETAQLQQGSPPIDSPTVYSAGGTLDIRMRDPLETHGGQIDVSYGTHQMNRQFIRYDTGEIGHSGVRSFASFSNLTSQAWRGPGRNNRRHVDFKAVKDWGDNVASLSFTYNNENTAWYTTPTLPTWQAHDLGGGINLDGIYTFGNPNYYKGFATRWTDYVLSGQTHLRLSNSVSLDLTPYFYDGAGNYPLGTYTLPASGTYYNGTQPVNGTIAGNHYTQDNNIAAVWDWYAQEYYSGMNARLHWETAHHHMTAGAWYGYTDMHVSEPFSALDAAGNLAHSNMHLTNGLELNGWMYHTITQMLSLYIGDEMHFLNQRLTIDLAFKEVLAARHGTLQQPGPQYAVGYNTAQPLPRLSISYKLNPAVQIFANATTNFRMPIGPAFYNQYNSPYDPSLYQTANTHLKDEYSISEELGARYHAHGIIGSIVAFNYNFSHHAINEYLNAVPYFLDAGGMTSRGIDAELGLMPWHHIAPYMSGEYLYATTDNNLAFAGTTYQTRGKIATSAPRWMGALGLQYDDGTVFGNISMKYMDKEYGTFTNDERIPGHKQIDFSLGLRGRSIGFLKNPSIRLNVINLTNRHYLSGVYSPGPTAGTSNYYVAPSFACLGTISTGF